MCLFCSLFSPVFFCESVSLPGIEWKTGQAENGKKGRKTEMSLFPNGKMAQKLQKNGIWGYFLFSILGFFFARFRACLGAFSIFKPFSHCRLSARFFYSFSSVVLFFSFSERDTRKKRDTRLRRLRGLAKGSRPWRGVGESFFFQVFFFDQDKKPVKTRISQRQSITQKGVHAHSLAAREREHWFLQHLIHFIAVNFGRQ